MSELKYVKLSDEEIQKGLAGLAGWTADGGKLAKSFSFESYLAGVEFAGKVGRAAEDLNHHPDLLIGWRKVGVTMSTHDVGGISPYDFELARQVEALSR